MGSKETSGFLSRKGENLTHDLSSHARDDPGFA